MIFGIFDIKKIISKNKIMVKKKKIENKKNYKIIKINKIKIIIKKNLIKIKHFFFINEVKWNEWAYIIGIKKIYI